MPAAELFSPARATGSRVLRAGITALGILVRVWASAAAGEAADDLDHIVREGRSVLLVRGDGMRVRLTPYGAGMIRVQAARSGEEFFGDDRDAMVVTHAWGGSLALEEEASSATLRTAGGGLLAVRASRHPLRLTFLERAPAGGAERVLLAEDRGVRWARDTITESFTVDTAEHFTGLGHGYFGRSGGLDLRGRTMERNYGSAHGNQAPLIVPFYISSRGYGVFLNSTFPNAFSFGAGSAYEFGIRGDGRMDFFVIAGPAPADVIDRYTQLTGRPRFPPLAVFGLGLSDKANDEKSPDPSDERWWKRTVAAQRAAGFPLDHLINDNRWRAGGGKRCESYFAWDSTRFPDPAEYARWVKEHGLFVTIDFNRCIASHSDGWRPSYNIPVSAGIDHGESAPDFTRADVRAWFWNLHWRQSLNPGLAYPGDALWIDEFDELGPAPDTMRLGNGRTWLEMKNYWFFLIARALVADGWDRTLAPAKRPFVWVRGMTAGAQRYATLWSGDIRPTWDEMRESVRGMQLAGLSGFPYWGHDAGGFYDWENGRGPSEPMYQRWSMAMGSFSPFWKPHGMGQSRWPLERSPASQEAARTYTRLRYALLPYTYTFAHEAAARGMPIARAMMIGHPGESAAWSHDLQYMWGDAILVAPACSEADTVNVWLPGGTWYDFWTDERSAGGRVVGASSHGARLPLFVMEGAIIPMAPPALSSAFLRRDSLTLHVYTGADGRFTLYEDDGTSEMYTRGAFRTTVIAYTEKTRTLALEGSRGTYAGAPGRRYVKAVFHGAAGALSASVNGRNAAVAVEGGVHSVEAGTFPADSALTIRLSGNRH